MLSLLVLYTYLYNNAGVEYCLSTSWAYQSLYDDKTLAPHFFIYINRCKGVGSKKNGKAMKGKTEFTKDEISRLARLVAELENATPDRKKVIRNSMRNLGFYITDFSNDNEGFNLRKLESLIDNHIIKIIG